MVSAADECNELNAVDLILGEVLVHGEDTTYHEDLRSLLELLRNSGDPEVEAKSLASSTTRKLLHRRNNCWKPSSLDSRRLLHCTKTHGRSRHNERN